MNWLNSLLDRYWYPTPPATRRIATVVTVGLGVIAIALATTSNSGGQLDFPQQSWPQAGSTPAASLGELKQSGSEMFVTVQLVGEITEPGVYQLPVDSRIIDAVTLAGGFSKAADQASINLARLLIDGEQIRVLPMGASASARMSGEQGSALINLNRASASELDALPGIGPTLAGRIIDYRNANGSFTKPEQLGKVAGIGKKLLGQLIPLITL